MSGCLQFEIDIERHRRDALDPEGIAVLQAHLEGCASCQRYAAEANTASLEGLTGPPPEASVLLERVRGQAQRLRRGVAWSITGGATCLLGLAWFAANGAEAPLVVFGGLGIALVAMGWAAWKQSREADVADRVQESGELLAVWRANLDEQIRTIRLGGPAVVAGAALLLGWALAVAGPQSPKVLAIFAVVLGFAGFTAYEWLVTLPRLLRERDALGRP